MSGPRTKRQFTGAASDPAQRQITSFFQRSSTSSSFALSSSPAESRAPLNGPVLPGQVQTNLLNVGMRVRKAVPEGYKTGTQYSAFKLWEDDAVPAPSVAAPVSATPNPIAARGMHELMPFCGLHKVGGLGVQEPSSVGGATATTAKDFSSYDFPMLGSQGSTISNDSTTSALEATGRAMNTNGKRLFVEAEDNDDGTSDFPETWSFDEGSRVLAVPRRRQGNANKSSAMMEQENAAAGPNGNDFEEAEFLQYEMEVEP